MGYPVIKYANSSTIVKCRFYGLKSILLKKQHNKTTKPKSPVQKSNLERYLELLTRIMWLTRFKRCKFFDYSKMSFLWTKKPPFDKTTWLKDKTKVSWIEKWARKILGTYDQNDGLTRFKICKFFNYSKMSFSWTKKPPFEQTTWSNDKTKVSCTDQIIGLERYLKLLTRTMG